MSNGLHSRTVDKNTDLEVCAPIRMLTLAKDTGQVNLTSLFLLLLSIGIIISNLQGCCED